MLAAAFGTTGRRTEPNPHSTGVENRTRMRPLRRRYYLTALGLLGYGIGLAPRFRMFFHAATQTLEAWEAQTLHQHRCCRIMDKARLFGATRASVTTQLLRHRSHCTGEIATVFVWRAESRSQKHHHRTLHRLLSGALQKQLANLPQPCREHHLKELAADTSTHLPGVAL